MSKEAYNRAVSKMIYWRTWESYLVSVLIVMIPVLLVINIPLSLYLPLYLCVLGGVLVCNDRRLAYRARAAWLSEET